MSSMQRGACAVAFGLVLALAGPALADDPVAVAANPAVAVTAAATTPTIAETSPATSPLLALVQKELADTARKTSDSAALAAYYSEANRTPLWVTNSGLSPRGLAAIAEIRKADDWGLAASAFDTPEPTAALASPEALAGAEVKIGLAVLKYANHARGGRIDISQLGRNFDQKPPLLDPKAVIEAVATAPEADSYLRGLQPKHPQFEKLRQALLALRNPPAVEPAKAPGSDVKIPAGPRIKPGQSHAQVALLRQRLGVAEGDAPQVLDEALQASLRDFQQSKGIDPDGSLNNITRTALNGVEKPANSADKAQRILVNMERWRWLPEDLGAFHVWDNVPEFRMRVMKDNVVAHTETIIVGKPSTPTPIFSADMKYVIFHPNWGVPDGIKMNELAPSLRRSSSGNSFFNWGEPSDPAILRRHNLTVSYNGRQINPATVDWSRVDIRQYQFTQAPSASNVLGVVKFRFPNKHDVYMHDTPERSLFARADKAFSHGCMRVHNPQRLAEVLLGEDKGWTSAQVARAIATNSTQDVTLSKQIPVHVTYFTAVVEDDGRVRTYGDIYGFDNRIASALEGKSVKLIAQTDPAVRAEREVQRHPSRNTRVAAQKNSGGGGSLFDIFSGLAGN